MIKVKICGITNLEDALAAAEYGADALGFIFYKKSPRCVDVKTVKKIVNALPPFITTVGVFVNETKDKINKVADEAWLDVIQLHGDEPPAFCNGFERKVIKVFRIQGQGGYSSARMGGDKGQEDFGFHNYRVSAYLLDTYQEGIEGGTGRTFNWDIAKKAKKIGRIILAGGLTPDNVAEAVKKVNPYAVDVSSGVEKEHGKKDFKKVKEFIERAKKGNIKF